MARRSKREIFDQARPTVEELVLSLRASKDTGRADAVQAVLTLAEDAVRTAEGQAAIDARLDKPFAIPVDSGLWTRASHSPNISQEITDGWEKFLAGEWTPVQPVRAPYGSGIAKANVNVRAPKDLIDRVEAAADRLVADNGWPTARGYKLNARHVAAQWLARQFPDPDDDKQKAAE